MAAIGLFVAALDAYAVVTLLPAMLADIDLPVDRIEQASPVISGFLGGYVVAMPLLGALSDRRGRLPIYLAGLAAFGVGSAVTAAAPALGWLVAGRAIQGLGGGALVPLTLAAVADTVAAERGRGLLLGVVSAIQEAGSVAGPAYGALVAGLAGWLGWRFVFAVDVPLAIVLGAALVIAWRRRSQSDETAARGPGSAAPGPESRGSGSLDVAGGILLGLGLAALVVGLYPADPGRGWSNPLTAPLLVASLAALVAFGWRQAARASSVLGPGLARDRRLIGALVANLLAGGALMVVLVDVPIFARGVLGVSQGAAGLLLTSFLAGVPVGAIGGGWLAGRLGPRSVAAAGLLAAAAIFVVMAGWGLDALSARTAGVRSADIELGALGVALGLVIAPLALAGLATAPREHGLVSSLVVTARTVGMVAALAALTSFGIARFRTLLAGRPQPPAGLGLRQQLRFLQDQATLALAAEYHDIFRVAAAICVLGALVAALTLGGRGGPMLRPWTPTTSS